jgi:hypothetical protein
VLKFLLENCVEKMHIDYIRKTNFLNKMLVWSKQNTGVEQTKCWCGTNKPQNSWPLLSQSSLPTWQPKCYSTNSKSYSLPHRTLVPTFFRRLDTILMFHFQRICTHLHTCAVFSHFTYLAVVRFWFGDCSHLVKPSNMNTQMVS